MGASGETGRLAPGPKKFKKGCSGPQKDGQKPPEILGLKYVF